MEKIDDFHGKNLFLSNFYIADVEYEGIVYKSSEHAFQAAKTLNPEERIMVASAETPGQSKKAGHNVTLRNDWDLVKASVMFEIVNKKFHSHPVLATKLMETYPKELIEGNTWSDHFFGVCNGYGKNILGRILMIVREALMIEKRIGKEVDFDKEFLK